MKFLLRRTSDHYRDALRPVGKKYTLTRETYPRIEVRTVSEEEFERRFAPTEGPWRSKGINHRVLGKNRIEREHPDELEGWFIEISTFEELVDLYEDHGPLVLGEHFMSNVREIEIYDDYHG